MAMLSGEYRHQLDAKNRLRIPAKLRKELGDEYFFAKGANNCIAVYSSESYEQLFERMKDTKLSDLERQRNVRAFSKSFVSVVEDGQGRIVLSPELRAHAKLGRDDKDLVICGAVNRVEIWSKKVFDEYFAGIDDDFDSVIAGLDI